MATTETLTIVLRADGSGLTGTLRTASGQVQQFGAVLDASSGKVAATGAAARQAAKGIDDMDAATGRQTVSARALATSLNTVRGVLSTLGISMLVRETLQAGLSMDRLERSTAAALGSQTLAARELGFVREQAQRLGIYFPTLAQGYAGLAAATRGTNLAGEQTRQIFLGVAEAGRAMNLSTDEMKGVMTAVQQIAGKGTVSMEEMRQQLGDRLPGAMQIAARAMNMTVAELVKLISEGKLASEDFLPKFAAEMRKSAAAGVDLAKSSPAATFDRLKTSLFELGAAVSRDGGVLGALATGASALTSAMNLLVSSGAIVYLTKGLLAAAAAGAVFYVGGLLQRGFVALATSIALSRAPLAAFNVGLAAGVAGAQGLTVRMTAASVATRGLATAMAFVQAHPIALAVTAVTLLVGWLYTSQQAAKQAAEELRQGFTTAKQALDEFNKTPSLEASFTLADAKIREAMEKLRGELERLRKEKIALDQAGGHMGVAASVSALAYKSLADEVASTTRQLAALEAGTTKAATAQSELVLQASGLVNVSPELRERLGQVSKEGILQQKTLEDMVPRWQEVIRQFGFADAAARMTADGVKTISAAVQESTEQLNGYAKKLAGLDVRLAEVRFGKAAGIGVSFKQDIDAAAMKAGGGDLAKGMAIIQQNGLLQKYVEAMNATIAKSAELDAAEKSQAEARKANAASLRDSAKAFAHARESQARYANQAALAAAELRGPLALAQEQYDQKIKALDADLAKHNITKAAYLTLVQAEGAALAKQRAEIDAGRSAPQALLNTMSGELELLRKIGPERELERRRLQAVTDMQRALAEAREKTGDAAKRELAAVQMGYSSWRDYEAAMLAAARANADLSMQIEQQAAQAEDWARLWVDAVGRVADAFTNFVMSGLRDFKGLAKDLKSIAKQMIGDLIRTFLQQKIIIPIQAQITQAFMGSGGSGAGGLVNIISTGFDSLLSGIGKLFGRGGSATQAIGSAAVSAAQENAMYLKSIGGAAGGVGGAAGGAMGSIASFAPYAALIAMGMRMAGSAWMQGFGIENQNIGGALMMGTLGTGGLMTPLMLDSLLMDRTLKLFGMNSKTAAILSGSSLIGKLFGHGAPQVIGQGVTGSYGFDGFTGQSYADIKQKGGLFRSSKYWTEYAAMDPELKKAFDTAAFSVRDAAKKLAAQAGMDISEQMAAVRIDIGKLQLSSDAETAKKQIEEAINTMMESLSAKSIEAMGFGMLLDDGYKATEIMTALSSALTLVTGHADKLERSLTALEVEKVQLTVEWFERFAQAAGTTLAEGIQKAMGLINDYSSLIGGVRTQIATHGLNAYQKAQLDVELQYRAQVKQANELAKALGLSGARAEDLAAIEQLRALQMADLAQKYAKQQQTQNQQWLQDLGLSDLSPLTDAQKLAQAQDLLNAAVAAGDTQRAQKLAEQVLGLGRNLYASGQDYNDLYAQVTGLVGELSTQSMEELQGLTNEQLANLADLVSGLPSQIAQELAALLIAPAATSTPTTPAPAPLPPPPTPTPPPDGGGGGGGGYGGDACVGIGMRMADGMLAALVRTGDIRLCHDPVEGHSYRHAIARPPVLQPCVRLVTDAGAALVCSRSTPFTAVDAPDDLPEYTTLAPDMLGHRVRVRRGSAECIETVTAVDDADDGYVVPLDFGGRSFPAGEDAGALIYSHNMQKQNNIMVGEPDPYGAAMVSLLTDIASSNASMAASEQTRAMTDLASGGRVR